jgi:hypothetical protein
MKGLCKTGLDSGLISGGPISGCGGVTSFGGAGEGNASGTAVVEAKSLGASA